MANDDLCHACARSDRPLVALRGALLCRDCLEQGLASGPNAGHCLNCGEETAVARVTSGVFVCLECGNEAMAIFGGPRLASSQSGLNVLRLRVGSLRTRLARLLRDHKGPAANMQPYEVVHAAGALQKAIEVGDDSVRRFEDLERRGIAVEAEVELVLRLVRLVDSLILINPPPDDARTR